MPVDCGNRAHDAAIYHLLVTDETLPFLNHHSQVQVMRDIYTEYMDTCHDNYDIYPEERMRDVSRYGFTHDTYQTFCLLLYIFNLSLYFLIQCGRDSCCIVPALYQKYKERLKK